ncbi:MAG TPA: hypothetical protein VFE58_09620 [Tepidisphaeraceae bacterium]|jgi:hypothetical protein|nr:hypothetical protein [Tepidisphaeraceae bacterium]
MTNDEQQIERLEREMTSMLPAAMPVGILDHLTDAMTHKITPQRKSDWLLLTAIGSGLAAAFVIVATLTVQSIPDTPAPSISPPMAAILFARADAPWNDIIK